MQITPSLIGKIKTAAVVGGASLMAGQTSSMERDRIATNADSEGAFLTGGGVALGASLTALAFSKQIAPGSGFSQGGVKNMFGATAIAGAAMLIGAASAHINN
jgi:hypothetical protein